MNTPPLAAKPKIKVAVVSTVDLTLRYLLLNQMLELQRSGYEIVSVSAPGPHVDFITGHGVPHIPIPMTRRFTPLQDALSMGRLYRLFRRERFQIVHAHTPKPRLFAQIAARAAGVPIVVNTLFGFYFHDNMQSLKKRFYSLTELIAAKTCDVILSQNSEDIKTAVDRRFCPPEKIRFLGSGVDIARFDRRAVDPAVVARKRAEIGLPEGVPVVGFVGRLVRDKGILELLEAAKSIRAQVPNVRFLIVGPVDRAKEDALTPEIAAQYGMTEACIFTGMRNDTEDLYAMMDVFTLPSYREGFPGVVIEASAMGLPCVVTDVRGCREAVRAGETGLVVPLKDVPALAEALTGLLLDADQRATLGQNARRLAVAEFDQHLVFARVKSAYEDLLRAKGRR